MGKGGGEREGWEERKMEEVDSPCHFTLPLGSFNPFTHENIHLEPFEISLQCPEMAASILEPSERDKKTKDVVASFKYPENSHIPHHSLKSSCLRMGRWGG